MVLAGIVRWVAVLAPVLASTALAQTPPVPGYPLPPPGFYATPAPPTYWQPGPAPPAEPPTLAPVYPPYSHGFLCLPYLGLNRPLPDSAGAYSVGFRAGSFIGYRVLRFLSLNAEMTIDLLHVNGPDSTGYSANEAVVDFTLSPLLHFQPGQSIVVIGPKLGTFRGNSAAGFEGSEEAYHGTGWSYGMSLGVFVPVETIAVGVLLNYTGHRWRTLCESDSRTRQLDVCNIPSRPRLRILGITAAMLF